MATWKMPPPTPKPAYVPPKVDFVSGGKDAEVSREIGAESLVANLLMLPKIAMDAAGKEMAIILHEVIVEAGETYVPIATGDLKLSGDSDEYEPYVNGAVTEMRCWYGAEVGPEALAHGVKDTKLYALRQHEDMEYKHHIGGAKYLEIPFTNKVPSIMPRLANAIGLAMGMNGAFVELAIGEEITTVDPDFGAK